MGRGKRTKEGGDEKKPPLGGKERGDGRGKGGEEERDIEGQKEGKTEEDRQGEG